MLNDGWPIHAFDMPVNVYNNLWLSGIAFVDDLPAWCKNNGFTHIVNAAGKFGRNLYYKTNPIDHNINYLELDIDDLPEFNLQPLINQMYTFVHDATAHNTHETKILIHCMWGLSRSVTCIIYFMMRHQGIKYNDCLNLIQQVKPSACPNYGFQSQLLALEIRHNSLLSLKTKLSVGSEFPIHSSNKKISF